MKQNLIDVIQLIELKLICLRQFYVTLFGLNQIILIVLHDNSVNAIYAIITEFAFS